MKPETSHPMILLVALNIPHILPNLKTERSWCNIHYNANHMPNMKLKT